MCSSLRVTSAYHVKNLTAKDLGKIMLIKMAKKEKALLLVRYVHLIKTR